MSFDFEGLGPLFADTFNEALSFGSEYTGTYNGGSGFGPPVTAPTQEEQVQQLLTKAGVTSVDPNTPMTADQILSLYKRSGIDIQDGRAQSSAQALATAPDAQTQQATLQAAVPQLQEQIPADRGAYQQALQQYGLQNVQFPAPATVDTSDRVGTGGDYRTGRGPTPRQVREQNRNNNYITKSGVFYFRNGVIADPNTGNVYYPSKDSIAGSPIWMVDAQKNWSLDKVNQWRSQLREVGYDVAKSGAWDSTLNAATQDYYKNKYLNGGNVLPLAPGAPGAKPERPPAFDLHQMNATIQNQVVQQFQSVYGQDPTDEELKSWTNRIIQIGMSLQRGGDATRMTPDAALSEAEARAARSIVHSPEGEAAIAHADENTTLHDALTTAIAATRGL